jgi:hypothetical protein
MSKKFVIYDGLRRLKKSSFSFFGTPRLSKWTKKKGNLNINNALLKIPFPSCRWHSGCENNALLRKNSIHEISLTFALKKT